MHGVSWGRAESNESPQALVMDDVVDAEAVADLNALFSFGKRSVNRIQRRLAVEMP